MAKTPPFNLRFWLQNLALRTMISALLRLPYRWRVPLGGWAVANIVSPLAGYDRRASDNLALIWPEKSAAARGVIAHRALDNAGRSLIENYSTAEFTALQAKEEPTGLGYAALQQAQAQGRAVILVSGHFGNYEAARASLVARGFAVGGLYRNLANPYFNEHYVQTMQAYGGPVFAQGRSGTSGFVKHLKAGGMLVLLFDQRTNDGVLLPFLGHPAKTALSAAALALRYDALLIPFFATRNPDGISFAIELDAPISHSDPKTMMIAVTKALEARVLRHPEQWFWVHRRWK